MQDNQNNTVDIGQLLDLGKFTAYQVLIVILCASVIIIDGFDNQLIAYAIPVLIDEWAISRDVFGPVMVAGLAGMAIGSLSSGFFADRFGRRNVLLVCMLIIGVLTILIGLSQSIYHIAIFRFLAGLGVGGALPVATTMAAEFTPVRYRTITVTSSIVCIAFGGMLAGYFAKYILPVYGWREMFVIGGILPLIFMVIILMIIPETPRFLARHPDKWGQLQILLKRMQRRVAHNSIFVDQKEQQAEGEGEAKFKSLFKGDRALESTALWIVFFFCMLAVYTAFSWLPTMITSMGLSRDIAIESLTYYNLGGVGGAILCAFIITRWGSRWPLLLCALGAIVSVLLITTFSIADNVALFTMLICIHGLFVNAVQSTLYALCAFIYPTSIRARGTSSAVGIGRIGAITAGAVGPMVMGFGGANGYLWLLAGAMIVVFVGLAVIRNHIPDNRKQI